MLKHNTGAKLYIRKCKSTVDVFGHQVIKWLIYVQTERKYKVPMNNIFELAFGTPFFEYKKLNGYENVNYLVKTKDGSFIFKTYLASEEMLHLIQAENEALLFLQQPASNKFPRPIPFKDASYLLHVNIDDKPQICRKLSYLEGKSLGDMQHTESLFQSLGVFLAELDVKLQHFTHPIFQTRQWEWDLQYLGLNKPFIKDIPNSRERNIIRYFFQQFEENVRPVFPELRKQMIHNDANEWNVLTQNGVVSGIIDFGDFTHSFLINELAIAIAYACFDKEDPLPWATIILKSYHEKLPLEEKEIHVLYYLIAARLCVSVCNSAHAKKVNPDNTYTSVSEKPAWQMLHRWLATNPIHVENQFRIAAGYPPKTAPSTKRVLLRRHQHISSTFSISYEKPIHMVRAAFQYMYDAHGNTFLDAYNNIPHVGHAHPKVVEAGQRQMAILNTNTRYLYDQLADYAEQLKSKFPPSLNKVYFVNSGSAASDLAIRMAKIHTGFKRIMVMELGYHGNTQAAIAISDYKFNNPKGQGQENYILKTQIPDTYKGKYTTDLKNAGALYAKDAVAQINNSQSPIAAFIAEPIVGCAGQVPLAEGYLKAVYPAIRNQGGVCISDEVQTGFGRTGDFFWGYEAQSVVPDIVILGKPIANGHPMGAVVCTDEIAKSFEKGIEFFSSFGGNPVSCAIASAVLDVIEEENLQEHAKLVGDYYQSLLSTLMKKHPCIGDVRGAGLFIGIEIVKGNSKIADPQLAKWIKNSLRKKNILVSTDGFHDNIIKSKPPLCFNQQNAKAIVDAIDEILAMR